MRKLRGLATGTGSFPHTDADADAALDLIFKYTPQIPFWPQLPKRDKREGMIEQYSQNLPLAKDEKDLEKFYERIISNDTDYFKISQEFASGLYSFHKRLESMKLDAIEFIKLQVTGPFTFAASFNDDKGVALLHDKILMQAIIKGLTMKALWQIKYFARFNKRMIMLFDEPYLGCFGSGFTPINRDEVVKGLSDFTADIKQYKKDVLIGVHCCGNTDWSIFTDVSTIDIINFDAYGFLDKFVLYAGNLAGFLERGGIICWGIVPTQEFSGKETAQGLIDKLMQGVEALAKKGIPQELILDNLLLSPSCGLGTLDPAKSTQILKLLSEVSSLLRR